MVQNTVLNPTIIKLVKDYGADITSKGISFDQLIVFGSHAKGTAHKWSDIDVCVVSDKFSDNRFDNRLLLMHNRDKEYLDIEPHPFRTSELAERFDPLASEIRAHGIPVQI